MPHNTDWSIASYINISTFQTVEDTIAITETLTDVLVKNCMLFVMKKNIAPVWEDPQNRNGGFFSYKISNKIVYDVWKKLTYALVGETLCVEHSNFRLVTGISVSPKKDFCIIKIWTSSPTHQNPKMFISDIKGLVAQGCLFSLFKSQSNFN
jgi:translation initiation factor 4E